MLRAAMNSLSAGAGEGNWGRTACALAFALFQMDCPPGSLSETTADYQLVFSAPPIRGIAMGFILSEWKGRVLVFISRETFALTVKSIHWILWKAKITGYFKRNAALITSRNAFWMPGPETRAWPHVQDDRQSSHFPVQRLSLKWCLQVLL